MWNLEQRCNVRENSSCLDEARSASLSTHAYQPPFTLSVYLAVCLSDPGMPLAVTVQICVSLCVMFSIHFLLCLYSFCNATYPLLIGWSSLSQCHPSLFFSSILSPTLLYFLFALSSSPPCLLHLLCPLPNCCIPALPSDRDGFGCVLFRACIRSIVCVHVCEGVHPSFWVR